MLKRHPAYLWIGTVLLGLLLHLPPPAWAYPEFQTYIQENSGRNVNCALCHAHGDGPDGLKPGQIGSLSPDEIAALGKARAAFEPGQEVDSPILNEFGNHIVKALGKQRILQLRQDPAALADELGYEHDIDHDGISDADEYLAGTHPVNHEHGEPWTLFVINIKKNLFHLIMVAAATILGLYGLTNLLHGFDQAMQEPNQSEDKTEV